MINVSDRMPYGPCECRMKSCRECHGSGPAALEATRNGKRIRLCTKCDLPTDTDIVWLVKKTDQAEPFAQWDALGFMCMLFRLAEEDEKPKGGEVL